MSAARPMPLPAAYWRQWIASAISNLGDGINFVAMPLLALTLTDDDRLIALTIFATFVPWIILALPVGTIVDRYDRQTLMVSASLVRVVMFGIIALGATSDWLTIWHLLGMIVIVGTCEVVFDSAAQAFLPMIVDSRQLARANGLLFAAEVIAGSIVGLAIGAFFFDWAPGLPFSINATTFAVAAVLILTIVSAKSPVRSRTAPFDRRLRIGFTWLRSNPLLTTLAWMFCFTNFGLMLGQGIFVKFAVDELGLNNNEYGVLLAITAMGAATGGLLGYRIVTRIGLRGAVAAPYLIFGAAQLLIGLAPPAWAVASAGFVLGAAITVWNIATVTVRQQVIPGDRFGRVNAVYRWLGAIASGAGVAAGGFIAYATNLRAPFLVGGVVTLGAAVLFAQPVLAGLRSDVPESVPEPVRTR